MTSRSALTLLTVLCLLHSCEKVDTDDASPTSTSSVSPTRPTSTGQGTQDSPYTVEQVIDGKNMSTKMVWYIGYVVGSTYSTMKNSLFEAETSYDTNILISFNKRCEDVEECIPVELKQATLKKNFSLHYHPECFRQCIMIQGRFGQYFRTNGIRDVQTAYWLPNFIIESVNPTPTEWEDIEKSY